MTHQEVILANQKINAPFTDQWELEASLRARGIFKIPHHMYQDFHTLAAHFTGEVAQKYIRGKLMQYISGKYPGKALVNFAEVHNGKIYEMWIQLIDQGTTTFGDLNDELKQLSYGMD